MTTTRKVAATDPHTGKVVTRGSKTMTYTHALLIHFNERAEVTIPAGTYTEPAKRIKGRNIPAYTFTRKEDVSYPAEVASTGFVSFHQGREAADKAGRAWVSKCMNGAAETRATFGIDWTPTASRYEIIEVTEV